MENIYSDFNSVYS